jgi:hypothetical protein
MAAHRAAQLEEMEWDTHFAIESSKQGRSRVRSRRRGSQKPLSSLPFFVWLTGFSRTKAIDEAIRVPANMRDEEITANVFGGHRETIASNDFWRQPRSTLASVPSIEMEDEVVSVVDEEPVGEESAPPTAAGSLASMLTESRPAMDGRSTVREQAPLLLEHAHERAQMTSTADLPVARPSLASRPSIVADHSPRPSFAGEQSLRLPDIWRRTLAQVAHHNERQMQVSVRWRAAPSTRHPAQ